MKIKNKDNILINSGNHKGKKGKVRKIIKKKTRALVKLLHNQIIEIDLSNLVLIYRPSTKFLASKNLDQFQKLLMKMRTRNNQLNSFFSIEEFKNLLKIRDLENINQLKRKNELFT
ncbi:KOW motif-containing protein [Candidatus Karelsulcia muelleri]